MKSLHFDGCIVVSDGFDDDSLEEGAAKYLVLMGTL